MTVKKITLSTLALLTAAIASAQNEHDKAYIIQNTNVEALQNFQKRIQERNEKYANVPHADSIVYENGEVAYFSGFSPDGHPVYVMDDNLGSIATHRADEIKPGGATGLNLDGTGIEIGHWEAGGIALPSHVELQGKIFHQESYATSSHSTHTSGTMIGEGVDPQAGGFAPEAVVLSWQAHNDEAEMAGFALQGGILSNHSYGSGNPHGALEGYGKYSFHSREWDEVLYNAPYLFVSKSAGNTRNDGVNPADQGYDLIYTTGVTKNVMTVGAVYDLLDYQSPTDVTQSVFSSWGPTDDWRIKPDIVANGVSLYSSDNASNTAYTIKSGTSMAAPSVTGSVALLQQYYHEKFGVYMKASTVKALLINSAKEAGVEEGPDFQNGWGLLDTRAAADIITNYGDSTLIIEDFLQDQVATYYNVTVQHEGPLRATIAWNDPAGTPLTGVDNTTPQLVNDLDMRLFNSDTTYSPWYLEPNANANNFEDAAMRGDNYRDNVERIDINQIPTGSYILAVFHKNNLTNAVQEYSIVLNGAIMEPSGLNDYDAEGKLHIFPNPAKNNVTIDISQIQELYSADLNILDIQGRIVYQQQISKSQETINTSNLSPGIYVIQVQHENRVFQEKLIIGQ